MKGTHLKTLLPDPVRCAAMVAEHGNIILDYTRQKATEETLSATPLAVVQLPSPSLCKRA